MTWPGSRVGEVEQHAVGDAVLERDRLRAAGGRDDVLARVAVRADVVVLDDQVVRGAASRRRTRRPRSARRTRSWLSLTQQHRRRHAREREHVRRGPASRGRRCVSSGAPSWRHRGRNRSAASIRCRYMASAAASRVTRAQRFEDRDVALGQRQQVQAAAARPRCRCGRTAPGTTTGARAWRSPRRARSWRGTRRWPATGRARRRARAAARIVSSCSARSSRSGSVMRSAASRAASASSAARTGNASSSSSAENARTEQPRNGSWTMQPSCSRSRSASRTGACETPARARSASPRGARPAGTRRRGSAARITSLICSRRFERMNGASVTGTR